MKGLRIPLLLIGLRLEGLSDHKCLFVLDDLFHSSKILCQPPISPVRDFISNPSPLFTPESRDTSGTMTSKANILLVGSGGVGSMAAYNLEVGGLASVTAVLRSNFEAVMQNGFTITSLDHGYVKGWKPSNSLYSQY